MPFTTDWTFIETAEIECAHCGSMEMYFRTFISEPDDLDPELPGETSFKVRCKICDSEWWDNEPPS